MLFPGSFSPYTDGHYMMLKRFTDWASAEYGDRGFDVTIIKSGNPRADLDPDLMVAFIKAVYSNDNRVRVVKSGKSGPIKACYGILRQNNGVFTFVRSSKDNDDAAAQFIADFGKGGKCARDGVTVLNPDIDCQPFLYSEGSHKDEPVSAELVRQDARDKDFDKFRTSFTKMINDCPSVSDRVVRMLFDKVSSQVGEE